MTLNTATRKPLTRPPIEKPRIRHCGRHHRSIRQAALERVDPVRAAGRQGPPEDPTYPVVKCPATNSLEPRANLRPTSRRPRGPEQPDLIFKREDDGFTRLNKLFDGPLQHAGSIQRVDLAVRRPKTTIDTSVTSHKTSLVSFGASPTFLEGWDTYHQYVTELWRLLFLKIAKDEQENQLPKATVGRS